MYTPCRAPHLSENFTAPPVTRLELIKTLRAVSKLVDLVRHRPAHDSNARLSYTLGLIGGLADQALDGIDVSENLTPDS
jgi:hypothetical protein